MKAPKLKVREYAYGETRWQMLTKSMPEQAEKLIRLAQEDVDARWKLYETLASGNGEKQEQLKKEPAAGNGDE